MKNIKSLLSALALFGLLIAETNAQEAIPAAGGNAFGNNGSVSYSIGQVVYKTYYDENNSVAEGVQQPYEISVLSGVEEVDGKKFECTVFPNPVTDKLRLSINGEYAVGLEYRLFDITGKLLERKNIQSNETNISTGKLVPATYFLT